MTAAPRRQIVVRLDAESRALINRYAGVTGYGSLIRGALAAYDEVCRAARPTLTPAEWRQLVGFHGDWFGEWELSTTMGTWSALQSIAAHSVVVRVTARLAGGLPAQLMIDEGGDPMAVPGEPGWRE